MKKILSVCVPTYNMELYLARCLDSFIIDKEYMDKLEIIVCNDGSKDNSSKIAHEYADKYPNTYIVIDKPNGNYGSCVNAALEIATGRYFRICDSDDKYVKENLSEYLDYLQFSQADIIFSPYRILKIDSTVFTEITPAFSYIHKELLIDSIDWGSKELIKYRAMHSMCIKTSILVHNNYKQIEGISYTDQQFVFYCFLYSETCSFVDFYIYDYYLGRDGQTMSPEAMRNSYMHFYKNAENLLRCYVELPITTSEEKRKVLFRSIMAVIRPYVTTILCQLKNINNEIVLLNSLIEWSNKSHLPCPINEELLKMRNYYLWKRFSIPRILFYLISHK